MSEVADPEPRPGMLGSCPSCDERIPPGNLLIEYRTSGGWPGMFAECPSCRDVVHPR